MIVPHRPRQKWRQLPSFGVISCRTAMAVRWISRLPAILAVFGTTSVREKRRDDKGVVVGCWDVGRT
jgi:hypothetical protein